MRNACVLLAVAGMSLEAAADSPGISGLRAWLGVQPAERAVDAAGLRMALSAEEAGAAVERKGEGKSLVVGEMTLRWLEKTFGEEPANGRSLWISLHGGWAAPQVVNDQQWLNQIQLYQPAEGIYVAPRAPTDAWNLWHEGHIDPMFQRLIEDYVAVRQGRRSGEVSEESLAENPGYGGSPGGSEDHGDRGRPDHPVDGGNPERNDVASLGRLGGSG